MLPFLSCSDQVAPTLKALGVTPLMAAVLVGAAQNVFSKSAKYSLFDPCKEMAYIPLDDEVRISTQSSLGAGMCACVIVACVLLKRVLADQLVQPSDACHVT